MRHSRLMALHAMGILNEALKQLLKGFGNLKKIYLLKSGWLWRKKKISQFGLKNHKKMSRDPTRILQTLTFKLKAFAHFQKSKLNVRNSITKQITPLYGNNLSALKLV